MDGQGLRSISNSVALCWRAAPGALGLFAMLSLVGGMLPLAVAYSVKLLLDTLTDESDVGGGPVVIVVVIGLLGIASQVNPALSQHTERRVSRATSLVAADELFAASSQTTGVTRLEDPAYLDRLLLANVASSTTPVGVVNGLLSLGALALQVAGFVAAVSTFSLPVAFTVVAAALPQLVVDQVVARRRMRVSLGTSALTRLEMAQTSMLMSGATAREVRGFGLSAIFRRRFRSARELSDARAVLVDRQALRMRIGVSLISGVAATLALIVAARAWEQGASVGDISITLAAVGAVQGSLGQTSLQLAILRQQVEMFGYYRSIVQSPDDLPVLGDGEPADRLTRDLVLSDVSFRYTPEGSWVLRNVDLRIKPGMTVALVGANGAGKSTIANLLCRFYDPTAGTVLWDGDDLRTLDPVSFRARMSFVFQDFMVYEMSLGENVMLGDQSADESRVRRAAELAGLKSIAASLPDGYRTLLSRVMPSLDDDELSSPGVVLSAGQGQRVAVARALVRAIGPECDLMILDEPNSALDAEADHALRLILQSAELAHVGKLLISHRLSYVSGADHIIVLDEGRVAEEGTHDDLMRLGGAYARLFALQADGYVTSMSAD
jgi:ATP-binding cassette, subfamily B, bacterial